MGRTDRRIDAYIARSADFAKPIMVHLRALIHEGCPEVEETMKWSAPTFMHHGILCGFATFKAHCVFRFWRGERFGPIASLKDLPGKRVLLAQVKEGMRLNEGGIIPARATKAPKKPAVTPADLAAGLGKNAKARAAWAEFSPSGKREYIEWITGAKRAETRAERLKTTLLWVSQGKQRNWKYMSR